MSQLSRCGMTVEELEKALKLSQIELIKSNREKSVLKSKNIELMQINMQMASRCNDMAKGHNEARKMKSYKAYIMNKE